MKSGFDHSSQSADFQTQFVFAGTVFNLSANEDRTGRCREFRLDSATATASFRATLAAESREKSQAVRFGLTFGGLIDALRLDERERPQTVIGAEINQAITIWHAALQILDRRYGARHGQMPALQAGPRPFLRFLDGGMA